MRIGDIFATVNHPGEGAGRYDKGWGEVVGGAAAGRVREGGGTPSAQLGGVGERCKLRQRFLR